jgi:hypothetical protein
MHHFEQKGCTDSQSSRGVKGLAALGLSATWPSKRRRDRGTDEIEVRVTAFSRQEKDPSGCQLQKSLASIPAFVRSHIATHFIGYRCIKMGDFLAYRNACLRDTMTRE